MLRGFKNFLMRSDIVVVAVGLIVAPAFSTLIKSFTDNAINLINAWAQGGRTLGLGWQFGRLGNKATFLDIGSFISALIYFIIFMAVVYFLIVVPYKRFQARGGVAAFKEAGAVKTYPACLSEEIPAAAGKCRSCGTEQPPAGGAQHP
ncbi:MscL family protein [Streptomyces sp. RB6PN25]|uniref:MscL family protein n=1 Tax=Streptomyces humicola TaxID=2953240 RepID=A0ABT1PPW6_9ACTN|nr:MscL family protein [Streptomyces humicola]MCQ4079725.1 MscL family protein [Streptomyces humicola]